MAQDQAEIRRQLRSLLAKANRRKSRQSAVVGICACLIGLATIGLVYDGLTGWLDFGGFMAGLLGCATGLVALGGFVYLDEQISGRMARRLAGRFRETFPPETSDYTQALALLKSAKSESKVEVDLIKALDEDILIGSAVPATGKTVEGQGKTGGGLLGELTDLKPAKSKRHEPRPGHIPLDPYGTGKSSGAA